MNTRGQAYSSFKLLIAAIVAVAILAILIPILMSIVVPGNDIQTVTAQMINNQSPQPGAISSSQTVNFASNSNLASSAIVGNSGLTSDQICLHKGDHASRETIEVRGSSLMNVGPDLDMKVSVMCNRANALMDSLQELGYDIQFNGQDGFCNCQLETTQKCCVAILKYA